MMPNYEYLFCKEQKDFRKFAICKHCHFYRHGNCELYGVPDSVQYPEDMLACDEYLYYQEADNGKIIDLGNGNFDYVYPPPKVVTPMVLKIVDEEFTKEFATALIISGEDPVWGKKILKLYQTPEGEFY